MRGEENGQRKWSPLSRTNGVLQTATFGEFVEPVGLPMEVMYSCPNVAVTHRVVCFRPLSLAAHIVRPLEGGPRI